jgi:hypothetical protein
MTSISIRIGEARTLTTERTALHTSLQAVWGSTTTWLRSTWCVINGGHYKVLHTEPERLALRCVACGHTSPGWEVGTPRLARRVSADTDRLRMRRAMAA